MESAIEITLFNGFEIRLDGKLILESLGNTRKTKLFLSYLLLHKQKPVPHKELFELLWSGEDYANPGTALRTLLYRYRVLIEKAGIKQLQHSILSRRGAYQWNPDLEISIDIFDFEKYSQIGLNKDLSIKKRKTCLNHAICLYKGRLLPDSGSEHWVVPRAVYYHDLYFKDVVSYVELLNAEGEYDEVIEVCDRALTLFGNHELLSLLRQTAEAKGGVSEQMQVRRDRILQYERVISDEIGDMQRSMEADDLECTAFVCDYAMFKEIYHLQRRSLARTGDTMFLTLLTMGRASKGMYGDLQNEKIMAAMLECCRHVLRCGDSICRCSDNQFAILFPASYYEDAQKVMQRVKSTFLSKTRESDLLLIYRIRPLKNARE